jgi:ribosome-binding factor A
MKSQRQLQMGQLVKKHISEIFLRDDLLSMSKAFITIAEADVSPDLKIAKIFLNIFGTDNSAEIIIKLNNNAGHFRHKLASFITARNVPEIRFVLDDTANKAFKIEALIESESKKFTKPNS